MSQSYLQRFRSSLPQTQGNQILKLLVQERDSGKIRTIDEFKNRLKELTQKLIEERITPTLNLFLAVGGQDTSFEQYNNMLSRIEDDLKTAFTEADNIDEIIAAHHNIINNIVLKTIRFGINELESKISLYEFIHRSNYGFDDALFNTFRESQNLKTPRSDNAGSVIYIDPKNKVTVPMEQDASVDFLGEHLLLGLENQVFVPVKNVEWLSNANSIRSELNVNFLNSNIRNIIDGQNNTFWVTPILLSQVRQGGVPMEICLELSTTQDINFIEIEPASNYPMVLLGIDYMDSNNIRRTSASNEIIINGPTRINFGRITATCVIIRVRQDNYTEIQFTQKRGESNFHKAVLGQSSDSVDLDSITKELQELLSSDFILSDIIGVPTNILPQNKFFEYILGFDNIRLGFGTFQERGIFVSSKKNVINPGQFGLKTKEIRPIQVAGFNEINLENFLYPSRNSDEDLKFYHGSVEYWLTMFMYSEGGFLIDTITVPVLPLGAKRIYHERLVFTEKSSPAAQNPDLSSLMFFADSDSADVLVYRNGTLLTYGNNPTADWEFVASIAGQQDAQGNILQTVNSNITNPTPNSNPMKRGIRIWDTVRPLDIYTVSYTPKVSNTRVVPIDTSILNIVDLSGQNTVRMIQDNLIVIESIRNSQTISGIDAYLTILIRRNSANLNFSSIVEEYMLLTGSRDQTKFISD